MKGRTRLRRRIGGSSSVISWRWKCSSMWACRGSVVVHRSGDAAHWRVHDFETERPSGMIAHPQQALERDEMSWVVSSVRPRGNASASAGTNGDWFNGAAKLNSSRASYCGLLLQERAQ